MRAAVASLTEQTLAPERYLILVVLNHEDEELRTGLEAELRSLIAARNARLRVVIEPRPGLSHARNLGLQLADTEYVAFMDDDAQAEPDWLENILKGFRQEKSVAAVGGPILPLWEVPPPSWVRYPMYTYFSCKDFGSTVRHLGVGEYFFGTNMAFTREVLMQCGGFPTNLGRKRGSLLSNEEWPVFKAIDAMRLLKLASPGVRVRHFVPRSRMTHRFFIRRLWWQGISNTVYHLECEGRSRAWVARQALSDFKYYYSSLPRMLRHGHSSWHLAFFNLFRWGGIARTIARRIPRSVRGGTQPRATVR